MWSGSLHQARTKVSWLQCCQSKDSGGINVINPQDALVALIVKWVLKAYKPGSSNLHVLIRHRLSNF